MVRVAAEVAMPSWGGVAMAGAQDGMQGEEKKEATMGALEFCQSSGQWLRPHVGLAKP